MPRRDFLRRTPNGLGDRGRLLSLSTPKGYHAKRFAINCVEEGLSSGCPEKTAEPCAILLRKTSRQGRSRLRTERFLNKTRRSKPGLTLWFPPVELHLQCEPARRSTKCHEAEVVTPGRHVLYFGTFGAGSGNEEVPCCKCARLRYDRGGMPPGPETGRQHARPVHLVV